MAFVVRAFMASFQTSCTSPSTPIGSGGRWVGSWGVCSSCHRSRRWSRACQQWWAADSSAIDPRSNWFSLVCFFGRLWCRLILFGMGSRYREDNDFVSLPLSDALERELPFDLTLLPHVFPPVTELRLWVYPSDAEPA